VKYVWITGILALLVEMFPCPARGQEQQTSIVAVFKIENRGTSLTSEELLTLTDYLGTRLGEQGRYQIVPRNEIRKRLLDQKQESYKACYDQSCQIEIGRELSAQYTVSASISKVGSLCILTAAMYDLRKAATEKTATAKGPCDVDNLVEAVESIVAKLQGTPQHPVKRVEETAPQPPQPRVTVVQQPSARPYTYRPPVQPRTKSWGLACLWGLLLPGGGMFYVEETGWGVAYLLTTLAAGATGLGFAISEEDIKWFAIGFGSAAAIDLAAIIHAMIAASNWRDPALERMEQSAESPLIFDADRFLATQPPPARGRAVIVPLFSASF